MERLGKCSLASPSSKEVTMEKRREFAEGEQLCCPKCESDDVDYDDAPEVAKCNACGQKFSIRQVVVWEE